MRLLLVQARDPRDRMLKHEQQCIRRKLGPLDVQLVARHMGSMNAFYGSPATSGHFLVDVRPVLPHKPKPTS
jgi:hypothetical protein